jgi:hypothetical protein
MLVLDIIIFEIVLLFTFLVLIITISNLVLCFTYLYRKFHNFFSYKFEELNNVTFHKNYSKYLNKIYETQGFECDHWTADKLDMISDFSTDLLIKTIKTHVILAHSDKINKNSHDLDQTLNYNYKIDRRHSEESLLNVYNKQYNYGSPFSATSNSFCKFGDWGSEDGESLDAIIPEAWNRSCNTKSIMDDERAYDVDNNMQCDNFTENESPEFEKMCQGDPEGHTDQLPLNFSEEERKEFRTWITRRRFVPEYKTILTEINSKQGFECNCWSNELIRAYKEADNDGKERLVAFHRLAYHS